MPQQVSKFQEWLTMLRITRIVGNDSVLTLKLEGKLRQPWVEELRIACAGPTLRPNSIQLDLSGVTFVDAAGAQLLGELVRRGFAIAACSGYITELLHLEKRFPDAV
jgi:ABC-type transporter Mla MlaB component